MTIPVRNQNSTYPDFLTGGGEMGQRIREFNWAATSVGPIATWPQSLRTCLRIMLTSRQPIWIGWGKDLIKFYNDPYKAIVGGKHPWALGKPAAEVWKEIWPDIGPMLKQVMEKDEGTYAESQLLIMDRNGYDEETYYTFSYTPIPGDGGGTAGMFCANTDDTERIVNERALKTLGDLGKLSYKEKTIHELYSEAAAVLANNNKDFPFAFFHEVDETTMQARPVAWAGDKKAYDIFPESVLFTSPTEGTKNISRAINQNEIVVVNNTGRWPHAPKGAWEVSPKQILHIPFKISNNKYPNAVLTVGLNPYRHYNVAYQQFIQLLADQLSHEINNLYVLDVERKRSEALAEIDRVKTTFFSNISHEFRTPLTLMLGPIEDALNDSNTIADNQVRMEVAHRNGLRLQKLVNTLLDFSRLEAGRMQTYMEEVDLSQLTADLASSFRSAIEREGMKLIVDCKPLSGPVYIDVDMWEKIVLNLLSNAFKYTTQGFIKVALTEAGDKVLLSVTDSGVGIPHDQLTKVFERFHRVYNSHGRSQEGTGIGLSLVQELVKLQDGKIEVESSVGKGSVFTVTLPQRAKNIEEMITPVNPSRAVKRTNAFSEEAGKWTTTIQNSNAITEEQQAPKKHKVLVADDNSDMREYITRLLQNDYQVLPVRNGRDAFTTALQHKPDLIISDVMMPVLDGYGLLNELRQHPQTKNIPLLFLSARAGQEAKVEGLAAGADDYLTKPFSAKELLARVESNIRIAGIRQTAQRNLYNLFVQAPVSITIMSGQPLRFEMVNDKTLEMWGKSREEVINKTLKDIFPLLHEQGLEAVMEQVMKTGQPFFSFEQPVEVWRNGQKEFGYFNYVLDVLKDDEGRTIGIMSTGQEVTVSVVARKKIEANEARVKRMLEQAPVAIAVLQGPSMVIKLANERQLAIWNRSIEDVIDKPMLEAFPEIKGQGFDNLLAAVYQTGEAFEGIEMPATLIKNGKPVESYFTFIYEPIRNEEGEVESIMPVTIDVTESVLARKKIEDSEGRLNQLANAMPQLVWEADPLGLVTYYNDRIQEFSGAYKGKDGNWQWSGLLHPDDIALTRQAWDKAVASASVYQAEHRIQMIDGAYRWHLSRGIAQKDADGNILKWYGTATDIHEQKEAEEKLQYFATLTQNIADAVIGTDKDFRITSWNSGAEIMYGWKAGEVVGKLSREITATKFIDDVEGTNWEKDFYTKGVWQGEVIQKKKDGTLISVLSSVAQIKDDSGNFTGAVGVNRDISEQKKTEGVLRHIKDQLELTFKNVPADIFLFDKNRKMIFANDRAARFMGYDTAAELLAETDIEKVRSRGAAVYEAFDEDGKPHNHDTSPIKKAFETAQSSEGIYSVHYKNGNKVQWRLNTATPLLDDDGKVSMVIVSTIDITTQKEAEKRIRESEEKFRTLAETLPQLVWMTDEKGTYEYASPQWEDYSGLDPRLESTWNRLVHPDDMRAVIQAWTHSLQTGDPYKTEARIKSKWGEYRWHVVQGKPLLNDKEKIVKWIGAFADIHDQKTLEAKLEALVSERTKELQRSNEDLQQFAHVASHDLKEPVRKVRTFGSRLEEEYGNLLPERGKLYLEKMQSAADRMFGLIDGVLNYSTMNPLEGAMEKVDLNTIFQNIETDLEVVIQQSKAVITKRALPVVEGSAVLLNQLFYNLINNALKFSKPQVNPEISIRAKLLKGAGVKQITIDEPEKKFVQVCICDNGIGFSQEYAEKIFKTFTRLNSRERYEGTGLGLALCKKIAERHHGYIYATAKEGAGACFYVLLPA